VSTGVQTKSSYLVKLVVGIMLRYAGLEGCCGGDISQIRRGKKTIGLSLSTTSSKFAAFYLPYDPENIQVI